MLSELPGTTADRRSAERSDAFGFRLLSPPDATIVDCGPRGIGIETRTHLRVGGLIQVSVFLPAGQIDLVGRVCWARLVGNRRLGEGEAEPVFRAGLSLVEGPSLADWDRLRTSLFAPPPETRRQSRPGRRVVKWRRPTPPSSS